MCLIVNWMQTWFESHPAEPVQLLHSIQDILNTEDPKLTSHLNRLGFQAKEYAWPILRTLFSNNFESKDWLRVFDHVFLQQKAPSYLNYLLIAFVL